MNLDLFPHLYGLPSAASCNNYLYCDIPDEDESAAPTRAPASLIPSLPSLAQSSSPTPLANMSPAPSRKSIAGDATYARRCAWLADLAWR
jgi:hypothetical protein